MRGAVSRIERARRIPTGHIIPFVLGTFLRNIVLKSPARTHRQGWNFFTHYAGPTMHGLNWCLQDGGPGPLLPAADTYTSNGNRTRDDDATIIHHVFFKFPRRQLTSKDWFCERTYTASCREIS